MRLAVSQYRVCTLLSAYLKCNYVTMLCEGCPTSKGNPNVPHKFALLLPVFGGCTATTLFALTYPKIDCVPEERKERNNLKWCRLGLYSVFTHLNIRDMLNFKAESCTGLILQTPTRRYSPYLPHLTHFPIVAQIAFHTQANPLDARPTPEGKLDGCNFYKWM